MATYAENELAVINYLPSGGSLRCFVYVDDSVTAMTWPTKVNIVSISPTRESVDIKAGRIDLDNVTVTIADDYTDYAEGFWYALIEHYSLGTDIQFMFILTEGASETYYFRGSVFRENVHWGEPYISGSTAVRNVELQLVSPLLLLKNVPVDDLLTYVLDTNPLVFLEIGKIDTFSTGELEQFVTVKKLIQAMLEIATGATLGEGAVYERGADLLCYDPNATSWYSLLDSYLWVEHYMTIYSPDYWRRNRSNWPLVGGSATAGIEWMQSFGNCFALLQSFCNSMGVIPKYFYGDSDGIYQGGAGDYHSIELKTRGRETTMITANSGILKSDIYSTTTLKMASICVNGSFMYASGYTWYVVNGEDNIVAAATSVPSSIDFDMKLAQVFDYAYCRYTGSTETTSDALVSTTNHFTAATAARFWDYSLDTPAYETASDTVYIYCWLVEVLAKYLSRRFKNGQKEYVRTYGGMKFNNGTTNTHQNLKIMAPHQISAYGEPAETYYAREVSKDIATNTSTVRWVKE